jgi:hypothetical protein
MVRSGIFSRPSRSLRGIVKFWVEKATRAGILYESMRLSSTESSFDSSNAGITQNLNMTATKANATNPNFAPFLILRQEFLSTTAMFQRSLSADAQNGGRV